MKKTITSDFFTTLSKEQFFSSFKSLTLKFLNLTNGSDIENTNYKLKKYLKASEKSEIFSYYNGRTAIYRALKVLGIKPGDEVIICSYNCISVINTIIQIGAIPIYAEIDNEFGIDINDLNSKISENTKLVIFQHTFGIVSDNFLDGLALCKEKNIPVMEDVAHALGTKVGDSFTGLFGDISIFSTGRDKVISSVTGGFLLVNNSEFIEKVSDDYSKLLFPDFTITIKNHLYNIIFYLAVKLYDTFGIGKILIFISRKLSLIPDILTTSEKNCMYSDFSYRLPNSLCYLVGNELDEIGKVQNHRDKIYKLFEDKLSKLQNFDLYHQKDSTNKFRIFLIFKTEKAKDDLVRFMKKNRIFLGTSWSGTNICPLGSNLISAKYQFGTCSKAEKIGKTLVVLPNHSRIDFDDVEMISNLIIDFDNTIS